MNAITRLKRQQLLSDAATAEAEVAVSLAEIELPEYLEGTYPLELQKLKIAVLEAEEALTATQRLVSRGLQSEEERTRAKNRLSLANTALEKLQKIGRKVQITRLEAAVAKAKRSLDVARNDSATQQADFQAALKAQEQQLKVADTTLESIDRRLETLLLRAPRDGEARYFGPLRKGSIVRAGQPMLAIVPASTQNSLIIDVLAIPVAAVSKQGGQTMCYVETPQGVEQRTVKLGQSNDTLYQVLDGLKEGERVLIGRVRVTPANSNQPSRRGGGTVPRRR